MVASSPLPLSPFRAQLRAVAPKSAFSLERTQACLLSEASPSPYPPQYDHLTPGQRLHTSVHLGSSLFLNSLSVSFHLSTLSVAYAPLGALCPSRVCLCGMLCVVGVGSCDDDTWHCAPDTARHPTIGLARRRQRSALTLTRFPFLFIFPAWAPTTVGGAPVVP